MNELLSTGIWQVELQKHAEKIAAENRQLDAQIAAFMAETGASVDDIVFEIRGMFPRTYSIRLKTPDEKWMEWQSNNHGWERPSTEIY